MVEAVKEKAEVPRGAPVDFVYLPPPDPSSVYYQEDFGDKFWRKSKENPFVPFGMGMTALALSYGLWQMKTGNKQMSQRMMRARIAAQGFTIGAIIFGVMYKTSQTQAPDKTE